MAAVSGRKCHAGAERDTFVPERGIFPGETHPLAVPLPGIPPGILPGTFLAPHGRGICIVGVIFFCGTDAFIEKNSYFWSNFTENILKHFLILMYFTVG
ncbi:MAG: hypothetical protein IJ476_01765 [Bacteroidales bacterium]|nr:hypothetical protein [Bacteroidales bacterium]